MKKIVSALLVCFLLVGSMFALVSCGGNGIKNGTYKSEDTTIKVSGDTFTVVEEEDGEEIEMIYTYELSEDAKKITLTPKEVKYSGDNASIKQYVDAMNAAIEALDELTGDELTEALENLVNETEFEKTDKGFKIYGDEYIKQ